MMAATAREIAEKLMRGHPTPHDLMSEFRITKFQAMVAYAQSAHAFGPGGLGLDWLAKAVGAIRDEEPAARQEGRR